MSSPILSLAALSLACTSSGCSALIKVDKDQCNTDSDCSDLGFSDTHCSAGSCVPILDWQCVGNVTWPTATPSIAVTKKLKIVHLSGNKPYTNLKVRACTDFDSTCDTGITEASTDDSGIASLTLYEGFRGYLLIEPNESYPNIYPSLVEVTPPPSSTDHETDLDPIVLLENADVKNIGLILGVTPDPAAGQLLTKTVNCSHVPSAGIKLSTDSLGANTVSYYMNGNGDLPSTSISQTSSSGEGGFMNIKPGFVTVVATHDGRQVSSMTVPVRASHATYLVILPSP
jgi:hypothetical protein